MFGDLCSLTLVILVVSCILGMVAQWWRAGEEFGDK